MRINIRHAPATIRKTKLSACSVGAQVLKELYGLDVTNEEFVPFVGTGEANFLGGVACKYGADFDAAAAKKRFFELYLQETSKPGCNIGFPGASLTRIGVVYRHIMLLFLRSQNWLVCRSHRRGSSLPKSRAEDSSCFQCRSRQGMKLLQGTPNLCMVTVKTANKLSSMLQVDANLKAAGFDAATAFDAIVSADKFERLKPAPDVFLAAARELGIAPENCVVIEDAPAGVQAAKAAGMPMLMLCQL